MAPARESASLIDRFDTAPSTVSSFDTIPSRPKPPCTRIMCHSSLHDSSGSEPRALRATTRARHLSEWTVLRSNTGPLKASSVRTIVARATTVTTQRAIHRTPGFVNLMFIEGRSAKSLSESPFVGKQADSQDRASGQAAHWARVRLPNSLEFGPCEQSVLLVP